MPISPDTKDWTWVLERPCRECGFDGAAYSRDDVASVIRANASEWQGELNRNDVKVRPTTQQWSVLEYACHVRDVYRIFRERIVMMQTLDNPVFANCDQDETAVAEQYELRDPNVVGPELTQAAEALAKCLESVDDDQWSRRGTRSNGSLFTIETLSLYLLHDSLHHLWDVTAVSPAAATGQGRAITSV
jgi:hypothetical protein